MQLYFQIKHNKQTNTDKLRWAHNENQWQSRTNNKWRDGCGYNELPSQQTSEQNSRETIGNMAAAEHKTKLQNKSTGQDRGNTDRIIKIKDTKVLEEITSCDLHTLALSVLMWINTWFHDALVIYNTDKLFVFKYINPLPVKDLLHSMNDTQSETVLIILKMTSN